MTRADRRSLRSRGYADTSPGAYFVTAVTYQREMLYGGLVEGEIRLNRHRIEAYIRANPANLKDDRAYSTTHKEE